MESHASDLVVLGIDPGVTHTGFGVVLRRGNRLAALDGGVIDTDPDDPLECRLAEVHTRVELLISRHRPGLVAVEDLFFGRNARTALAVGQARGVVLLAAAQAGLGTLSYTPQQVKLAVCGTGAAGKAQVQRMVARLLSLSSVPEPDHAADALAVGICGATAMRVAAAA